MPDRARMSQTQAQNSDPETAPTQLDPLSGPVNTGSIQIRGGLKERLHRQVD